MTTLANLDTITDNIFSHIDGIMGEIRTVDAKLNNMYASNALASYDSEISRDVPGSDAKRIHFVPPVGGLNPYKGGVWFKSFATVEKVRVGENGSTQAPPKFGNNVGGALIGADFPSVNFAGGHLNTGIFGGYAGSHQYFPKVGIYQNQGAGGAYANWIKGNAYISSVANASGIHYSASTNRGKDNFGGFNTGVSLKTGYAVQLPKDIIIEPSGMISYQYLNPEDFTNSDGLYVKQDAIHSLRLQPGVKLAKNFGSVQPYLTAQMNFYPISDANVTVSVEPLPTMSVKPYVEYGVGVSKFVTKRWGGFLEATYKNGGRTGGTIKGGLTFSF
ncbi:hypothetical protein AGMMS49573_09360 [Endomicrobiia bacterium]|nr:hypothetical protein AGMMS49573_09310 [Endomicrobiia bacterium]GHT17469.1 hypothetical protein AGMMS49573_09360 [Endomicrobiia bacterium]